MWGGCFFCKQKTAYEMRISDWSSDVCSSDLHMEDVHRAGGIMAILGELDRAGLLDASQPTVHAPTLADVLDAWDIPRADGYKVRTFYRAAPGGDRKSAVQGQSVSVCLYLGGGRIIKQKTYVIIYIS